jgi:elongation factor G
MSHKVDDIHSLALVGHEVSGKTSLADALLFKAKAVERRGSPEDGSSVSDFDEEEKKHKYSIDSSLLHLDFQGKRVYLVDTPGKPDFVGQALCGLNAVDTAILVISATAGIQVNTRRMFKEAGKRGQARMIVINKLDSENIHFDDLLKVIRDTFGKACVLFNAPINVGPNFSGVVSVLNPPASAPAGCSVDLAAQRSQLIDSIVEIDEGLME